MATDLNAAGLAAVPVGGTIHEDLMNKIFDVSPVDRPFCDSTNIGDAGNTQKEWVREALEASNSQNKRIDGSSSAGINNTVLGERLSNYHYGLVALAA